MGCHLLQLPAFRESILRSDQALKDTGLVVSRLLMEADDATFEDTVHAFVGLAAIQVQQRCGGGAPAWPFSRKLSVTTKSMKYTSLEKMKKLKSEIL